MRFLALAVAMFCVSPTHALEVLHAQSTLGFSVRLGEQDITATFQNWSAEVDLEGQHILVVIDTASATTDNPLLDAAMHGAEWIDSRSYPTATFTSFDIGILTEETYTAQGTLVLKGVTLPARVTIRDIASRAHQAYGIDATVDRTKVGIVGLTGALDQHVSVTGLIVIAP